MKKWQALALVLVNLRESAYASQIEETWAEHSLATALVSLLRKDKPDDQDVHSPISEYLIVGERLQSETITGRAAIITRCIDRVLELQDLPAECLELELRLLTIGIARMKKFLSSKRLDLCYIEADHLHNSPRRILSGYWEGLGYYLKVERQVLLERFRFADSSLAQSPEIDYLSIWQAMENLISP